MALTPEQTERYSRHILLHEVGVAGQEKLAAARVLVIGLGGLGSPAAVYLARAGVGNLGVVDFDTVSLSNLHRQILYRDADIGKAKTEIAEQRLRELAPDCRVQAHHVKLTSSNAAKILGGYDVVLDCTDNFASRYVVNDACLAAGKPNVYGSIFRFEGQVTVFDKTKGPCLRCFFPVPPKPENLPNCNETGVIGVLPGMIGVMQATEALKVLLGFGEPLLGRVLIFDALKMRFSDIRLRKNPLCAGCGAGKPERRVKTPAVEAPRAPANGISPETLRERLRARQDVVLLDVRSPSERAICQIAGSRHLPVSDIDKAPLTFNPEAKLVVYCKTGMRSLQAKQKLESLGFRHVENLQGGILNWIERVDPSLPRY